MGLLWTGFKKVVKNKKWRRKDFFWRKKKRNPFFLGKTTAVFVWAKDATDLNLKLKNESFSKIWYFLIWNKKQAQFIWTRNFFVSMLFCG
jgi:hypothetical protein